MVTSSPAAIAAPRRAALTRMSTVATVLIVVLIVLLVLLGLAVRTVKQYELGCCSGWAGCWVHGSRGCG